MDFNDILMYGRLAALIDNGIQDMELKDPDEEALSLLHTGR